MKNHYLHICLIFALFYASGFLHAQTKFSYRIINENVFTYNAISDYSQVNPNNLLELDELEVVNRFFPVGTFKKDKIKIQAEPRFLIDPLKDAVDFSLNELYVQYGISEKFYVTFGKKRVNWGTATVWNPSNPFLQKDPFRLDNRLEGIFLTDLEYIMPNLTINALFSPSERLNTSTFAFKASAAIKSFNYSFSYAFLGNKKQQYGVDFSLGTNSFTFYGESILRNFSNTGLVNTEGNLEPTPIKNDIKNFHSEFVLGSMLNVFSRTTLLLEYRFRSDFNSVSSIDNFESYLPNNLALYDPISMGRHSFFSQINYTDPYSKYGVNTSVFYDAITDQLLCAPGFTYNGEDFKLEINPFIYNNSLSIYDFQGRVVLSFFL